MKIRVQALGALSREMLEARRAFDCGSAPLNAYWAETAVQHERKNIARIFCALPADRVQTAGVAGVAGFYALTTAEVDVSALSPELVQQYRLPTHRLPVVRLARLAVDRRYQGQGVGAALLIDALRQVLRVAASAGCVGLVVDAKDAEAAAFYQRFGFAAAPEHGRALFMPLPTIKELFEGGGA